MQKKLYRSRTDSVFAGVCGGIAKYFNVDATLVRVITVVLFLAGSVGFWVYVILGLVIPKEPYAGYMDQYNNNGIDPNGYVDRNMGGYYGDPNANYGGMPYNNGYPNGGYPNNGYQNNGYPNGGYPNNGYQNNGYPNNGFYNGAPNGIPNGNPNGYPNANYGGMPYQGNGTGFDPNYPNNGYAPYQNNGYPNIDPQAPQGNVPVNADPSANTPNE